jgi:hypothetical protein
MAALKSPIDTFLTWYDGLPMDQRLRIAIDLIFTNGAFEDRFVAAGFAEDEAPRFYLGEATRPETGYMEILGRIGVLKTLVDVRVFAQHETEHVTAFVQADYLARMAKARAQGSEVNADAARIALERTTGEHEASEALYVGWSDLVTSHGNDQAGDNAPLSPRYLYRWACVQAGLPDPYAV